MNPKYTPPAWDSDLPFAIICDIDGTLAHNVSGRSPYDWHRVGEDVVDEAIWRILRELSDYTMVGIILVSGRDAICAPETTRWLEENGVHWDHLHMRPVGDNQKDSIIKERIYREHIEGKYNVLFVLDDRKQVVDMWRSLGLKCLQVQPGDF